MARRLCVLHRDIVSNADLIDKKRDITYPYTPRKYHKKTISTARRVARIVG